MTTLKTIVRMTPEELEEMKDKLESDLFYVKNQIKLRKMFDSKEAK